MERYIKYVVLVLFATTMLTGCGKSDGAIETSVEAVSESATDVSDAQKSEEQQEILTTSSIGIDRNGYRQAGKKYAFLVGKDIDEQFEIINTESKESVFKSELVVLKEYDDGRTIYLGDFSDYIIKGTFQIYNSSLGYSEIFEINQDIYTNYYRSIYSELESNKYESNSDWMYVLSNMLLTHDVYADAFTDSDYIASSIETLIYQQDDSGAVFTEVMERSEANAAREKTDEEKEKLTDIQTTATFAGLLAQYASIYNEDNPELALECVNAAKKAYEYVQLNSDQVYSDLLYYEACELYRATGQSLYLNAVKLYDEQENKKNSIYNYTFIANISYLKSNYRTDYERSKGIMNSYLKKVDSLSSTISKANCFVQSDIKKIHDPVILDNMMEIAMVSYVVSGYEYSGVVENYMHYINGANDVNKVMFFDEKESQNGMEMGKQIEKSKLIFVLGHFY